MGGNPPVEDELSGEIIDGVAERRAVGDDVCCDGKEFSGSWVLDIGDGSVSVGSLGVVSSGGKLAVACRLGVLVCSGNLWSMVNCQHTQRIRNLLVIGVLALDERQDGDDDF